MFIIVENLSILNMFHPLSKKKNKLKLLVSFSVIMGLLINPGMFTTAGESTNLHLVFDRDITGSSRFDFGSNICQYLSDIEIDAEVYAIWSPPMFPPYPHADHDLAVLKLEFNKGEPDYSFLKNIPFWSYFPSSYSFPYKEELKEMIRVGPTIGSEQERREYYNDLHEFYMDKILLSWPLFTENSYESLHSNTLGFDRRWGWVESIPYMSYEGLHEGQTSLNEYNIADGNWRELNPFFTDDSCSKLVWDLMSEPLIKLDPDGISTGNGLISNWFQVNSSHYQFYLRPNIYWTPSYNITSRTASSEPLVNATLITGLKGEYSDGTNQLITAKDAVFTLLAWANPILNDQASMFNWMKDVYVDPLNPQSFHIYVDGDPETNDTEYYSLLFEKLELSCLPEFFLNSTDDAISYTASGIKCEGIYPDMVTTPAWESFSVSGFGCGKFMLDYAIDNYVTVLQRNPFWFGVGAIDGTTGLQPFVETVNIRVIPDTSAELLEFKAGKLDWTGVLASYRSEREQLVKNPLFDVYIGREHYMDILMFNINGEGWGNLNNEWVNVPDYGNCTKGLAIRKAICHAIDREELADFFLENYTLSDCMVHPEMTEWFYEDIPIIYEYDLIKAATWMNHAGFDIPIPTETTDKLNLTTINLTNILSACGLTVFVVTIMRRRKLIMIKKE